MERTLTILNERGDTTLTWQPDQDAVMEEIITKKLAAGVTFYIIAKRKAGQRGTVAKPKKLTDASKAHAHRCLSIPDADFSKFVLEGKGEAIPTPSEPVETVRKAASAKDVASNDSVGVKPRRGG